MHTHRAVKTAALPITINRSWC